MKTSTLATRLAMAAILLTVLLYFGIHAAIYVMGMDPYTTSLAYAFTCDDAVTVNGYVVRREQVLPGGGELVYSPRREGERVSAGGTVALIYQTAEALSEANTLRGLEEQMDQLLYARSLAGTSQVRPDEETAAALLDFRQAAASGDLEEAVEQGSALRSAVLKRSYAYSGTEELDASIASLQGQIASLSASADPATTRVTAPQAGLFSSLVDGYEAILNPEMAETLTPSSFAAIASQPVSGAVGRMIYGKTWAFVCCMQTKDMGDMLVGDRLTLRFHKGLSRDMEVKVASISAEENGQRVVVFSSEKYLSLTTLLRSQSAQVIFHTYDGIRVPRSAVRVEQVPVTDEDGNILLDANGHEKTQPVTCVFTLWGELARRKPVRVLWQEDEYMLVAPDDEYLNTLATEGGREGRRLRSGEQVITAAADLYDGKVIR